MAPEQKIVGWRQSRPVWAWTVPLALWFAGSWACRGLDLRLVQRFDSARCRATSQQSAGGV